MDDPGRLNAWTADEFSALVRAWEWAQTQPRGPGDSLHDVVYRRFVVLCGGSSRRNKAALVSKRSALKFSYLFVRDFDAQQSSTGGQSFFELSDAQKSDVMRGWKQINSSVVELSPDMFQGLQRIVDGQKTLTKAGITQQNVVKQAIQAQPPVQPPPQPVQQAKEDRASRAKALGKRKAAVARAVSNPWSLQEMLQLVEAWGAAAQLLCDSKSEEPLSMVHEMYRQFERLQGGRPSRNLSGMATRRRVLRQSFFRVQEFNKMQALQGDPMFADLPLATRQNVMRGWKNSNLVDLPAELYDAMQTVIPLDSRAVALEDQRRARAGTTKISNAVTGSRGKRAKAVKRAKTAQNETEDEEASVSGSSKWSLIAESEEEKPPIPSAITIPSKPVPIPMAPGGSTSQRSENAAASTESGNRSMLTTVPSTANRFQQLRAQVVLGRGAYEPEKAPSPTNVPYSVVAASTSPNVHAPTVARNDGASIPVQPAAGLDFTIRKPASAPETGVASDVKAPTPAPTMPTVVASAIDPSAAVAAAAVPRRLFKPKKHRKVILDGPGKTWSNEEIETLVKAWEKAAQQILNNPSVSLNKEMYREFTAMQGGSSARNITSLAARRSSLKFSYQHIFSFNEARKKNGEAVYHDIPQEIRMNVLRSWKNRNSVDLSKETFDALGRIIALDDRVAEARALHRSGPHPVKKTKLKPIADHKTAKWTAEESSDLIKACADVMNVPTDKDQTATERESLIYDRFVVRRQNAGDTDTPVRRDLRAMAQQWRYILSSYTYIKTCNDKAAEMDSPSWFAMSPGQKRAYQQCTIVPLKFVDLTADMFALVTETSFDGVASAPLPSPGMKPLSEGISLRPRETLKRTKDPYMTSDSESSVSFNTVSRVKGARAKRAENDPLVKKGNSWPSSEVWNLIKAWEEGAAVSNNSRLASSVETVYERFTKLQEGAGTQPRSIHSVRNKMIALKSSFLGVANYIKEQNSSSAAWYSMTSDERMEKIRGWKNKTVMDLNLELYEALERILPKEDDATIAAPTEKQEKRKLRKPKDSDLPGADALQDEEKKRRNKESRTEKLVVDWTDDELLKLAPACGELLEGRRTRRYLFEEEKNRFFQRYQELGGGNPLSVAVARARILMDAYEFIYAYNEKAEASESLLWFELAPSDREAIEKDVSKTHRSFNGLASVDAELFDAVDEVDEAIRQKLSETKRKTYKPPTDGTAGSSRYADPDFVVQGCLFRQRKQRTEQQAAAPAAAQAPIELRLFSSSSESSSESSSTDDESASDYRNVPAPQPAAQPVVRVQPSPRPMPSVVHAQPVAASRKRVREAIDSRDGSSTLYIAEIIQQQTQRLEEAVKRFRKDSSDARKEHHEFLLRKLQDSFPVDNGNGSYLERVAERQGQSLVEIFQKLQQQRDEEKAKDRELMRQLFGRSELS